MKQPWPIEHRSPIHAPGITWTKCQIFVSAPTWVFGPSITAVLWMNGSIGDRMRASVPKRPPREARELPIPRDLRGNGPTRAHADHAGELWHSDVFELLGKLPERSVDLVVTDPPYAIAKDTWDEFESLDVYVEWCD